MNLEQLVNQELERLYALYRTEKLHDKDPQTITWLFEQIKKYNDLLIKLLEAKSGQT